MLAEWAQLRAEGIDRWLDRVSEQTESISRRSSPPINYPAAHLRHPIYPDFPDPTGKDVLDPRG